MLEVIVILGADIWFCFGWVSILFLGFCCPFLFLGKCWLCVAYREIFWDPDRFGHWIFQVKYVSRYWKLTLRMGMG